MNAGNTATACTNLQQFISDAKPQKGKLTVAQANELIARATYIRGVIGRLYASAASTDAAAPTADDLANRIFLPLVER